MKKFFSNNMWWIVAGLVVLAGYWGYQNYQAKNPKS